MKFNTEVWFMGEKLSNNMEGIEVANYDQLSNLTIDSELVTLLHSERIPCIISVNSKNNDPYKINIDTIEYSTVINNVENNNVVPTVIMNIIKFTYADLVFVDDGDWGIYPIDDEADCYEELIDIKWDEVLRELRSLRDNHKLTTELLETK